MRDDAKREMPAFVDYLFSQKDVSVKQLFTANVAFVSGPLAGIYGVQSPAGSETSAKKLPPPKPGRAGF